MKLKLKDSAAVSLGKKRWKGKTRAERLEFSKKGLAKRLANKEIRNETAKNLRIA